MSFILFSDSSCNLPCDVIVQHDVRIVPLSYNIAEETYSCYEEGVPFDSKGFFDRLRAGALARTTLINTDTFLRAFEPVGLSNMLDGIATKEKVGRAIL